MTTATITRNRDFASTIWQRQHLDECLATATATEWAEGLDWYTVAHNIALDIASTSSLTPRQAAGIIAALSPQVAWDRNVEFAYALAAGELSGGAVLPLSADRAKAIAADAVADPLTILGGPKVRSFYRNILEPDRPGPVTIDRHALAILHGTDTPRYLGQYPKAHERKFCYKLAAAIYRSVARSHGYHPHQIQAVAWVTHRNADYVPEF